MNITRHNYEEYFILYLDNELSSEDRRMVEEFVQQHPDLKEELDTLLQYKMVPDAGIVFEGKEELMKQNGHSLITATNYEEWLSLYIDNELSAEQKQLVDQFIANNPGTQKELELLQQTKLQPEHIVFADKASLYRREEKVRRIVPIRWRAAAAILILLLGATAVIVLNRKSPADQPPVVITNPGQSTTPVENNPDNENIVQPNKENSTDIAAEGKDTPTSIQLVSIGKVPTKEKQSVTNTVDKNQGAIANNKVVTPDNKTTDNNNPVIKKEESVVADINNKPSNNLPQPLNNPNTINKDKKQDDALANNNPDKSNKPNNSSASDVTKADADASPIIRAGYTETLEQPDGKKNKNRGLFRKIARTFEKRTNIDPTDDDNRLLVAGLAIKLK